MRLRPGKHDAYDLRRRFPPPTAAFAGDYGERHGGLVREVLDSPALLASFGDDGRLPDGYGIGLDERVVEFPWVLHRLTPGARVLDAGSTLNHAHILDRVLPGVRDLTIVTLAPEPINYPERGISYVYADLRDLPFRDQQFDVVTSISTLEHVGMDNSVYGGPATRDRDPDAELEKAVRELSRLLAPGGKLLISVPVGRSEDHGWFRQFDRRGVERLIGAIRPSRSSVSFYAYSSDGWRKSPGRRIDGVRYHEVLVAGPASDRAVAARAIACIEAFV
jgi:SAM-dependent methyltransferase